MNRKIVPVKTNEGAQEIKARALGLAPRIRTALLLVDGVKSVVELERLLAAAGVTPGALQMLLDKGLIRFPEEPAAKPPAVEIDSAHPCVSRERNERRLVTGDLPAAQAILLLRQYNHRAPFRRLVGQTR